jgi:hypothetical protein
MLSASRIRIASTVIAFLLLSQTIRADLEFTEPKADAGTVKSGAPLVREFAFTNRGAASVEIVEIQGSCGCLKPKLERRVYKPGEGDTLRIEVNTLTQGVGPHSWRTVVRYREGDTVREADVTVSGTVVAEIAVEPPQLSIHADRTIAHELRVIDGRGKPFTVTSVQTSSQKLTARVTTEARDDRGRTVRTIQFRVGDDYPAGRRDETLTIYTDDPLYGELKVPVTVVKRVRNRLSTLPESVTLSAPRGQALPSKIVRLRDSRDETVEIERITSSNPAISCTWARGPGTNVTLRVTVDRAKLAGDSLRSSVEVHLLKPAAETVVIPVTVTTP